MNAEKSISLTPSQKQYIIDGVRNNKSIDELCTELGCPRAALEKIMNSKTSYQSKLERKQIHAKLSTWYIKMKAAQKIVSSQSIKQKAAEIGKELGYDFIPTNAWFYRWWMQEGVKLYESLPTERDAMIEKKVPSYDDIEQNLLDWYKKMDAAGRCVSEGTLKIRASKIADAVGKNFVPTNDWLQTWLKKYHVQVPRDIREYVEQKNSNETKTLPSNSDAKNIGASNNKSNKLLQKQYIPDRQFLQKNINELVAQNEKELMQIDEYEEEIQRSPKSFDIKIEDISAQDAPSIYQHADKLVTDGIEEVIAFDEINKEMQSSTKSVHMKTENCEIFSIQNSQKIDKRPKHIPNNVMKQKADMNAENVATEKISSTPNTPENLDLWLNWLKTTGFQKSQPTAKLVENEKTARKRTRSKCSQNTNGNKLNSKRYRKSRYSNIKEQLLIWYKEMKAAQENVTMELLRKKTIEIAKEIGSDYEPTSGFLSYFCKQNDIQLDVSHPRENIKNIKKIKNIKNIPHDYIKEQLFIWHKEMKAAQKSVTMSLMRKKGAEIARDVGYDYEPTSGFLINFCKQNGILLEPGNRKIKSSLYKKVTNEKTKEIIAACEECDGCGKVVCAVDEINSAIPNSRSCQETLKDEDNDETYITPDICSKSLQIDKFIAKGGSDIGQSTKLSQRDENPALVSPIYKLYEYEDIKTNTMDVPPISAEIEKLVEIDGSVKYLCEMNEIKEEKEEEEEFIFISGDKHCK